MANDNQYVIDFTDSTKSPIVIDETKVDTSTDITLFGRRKLHYGADMNQNLLSLLEHFACPEDSDNLGYPNLLLSGGKLENPKLGQFWYNSTTKVPYVWNGTFWEGIFSDSSIATNWGILQNGERIPAPIDSQGNTFDYSECVWVISPFTMASGEFDSYVIETDINGFITCTYTKDLVTTTGFVNYLIVGIKNNINKGTLYPVLTPSPTPTISPTPSATPEGVNLLTGLVSYWEFEESGSSNTFSDSNSGVTGYTNTFTRNGLATSIIGKVGDAISPASDTYFSTTPPVYGLSTGNNAAYTFGGWFKLPPYQFISYAPIFQRGIIGEAQNRSFHLQYIFATDSFSLSKSNNGITLETLTTSPNVGFSDGDWHFIVAWVDGSHLTMNIQIDNGEIYTLPVIYSATYDIGNLQLGSSSGIPLQCSVDQLFYYNRVLNVKERKSLYDGFYGNGGGSSYAYVSGIILPSPTPTNTPTVTPTRTSGVLPLSAQIVGTHTATGICNGGGSCSAVTNGISAVIENGSPPYAWEWIYMEPTGVQPEGTPVDTIGGISNPSGTGPSAYTTFTRTAVGSIGGTEYNGYYRLKSTDNIGDITYSAPVLVTTTHYDP